MSLAAHGSVDKRCGCRDAVTGRRKGRACDLLRRPGHGSWYLTLEIPAVPAGERRRLRLGGYRSRQQAEKTRRMLQAPTPAGSHPGGRDVGPDDGALATSVAGGASVASPQHATDA